MLDATKPLISPELEDKEKPGKNAPWTYNNLARALADTFLKGPSKVLLAQRSGSDVTERRNRLINLIKEYRELSFQLWYQGVEVKCYYLGSPCVPTTYDPESDSMELHTALQVTRDTENHKSLNGCQIMIVTRPAIGAIWVPEGSEIEQKKLWVKSVVWVHKDNEQQGDKGENNEVQQQNIAEESSIKQDQAIDEKENNEVQQNISEESSSKQDQTIDEKSSE